jgi:hypothetical protein
MKNYIEVNYDLTNHTELEDALNLMHGDCYKMVYDDDINFTPSLICKADNELVGAMFFTKPFYNVKIYETHVVFEPKVNYTSFK